MKNQLVESTRFLAAAVRLGQPLGEALKLVDEKALEEAQASGDSLSQALSRQPERFHEFYRASVKAAESSSEPGAILEQLCDWLELRVRLDRRLATALYYPLLILDITIIQAVLLVGYIIPVVLVPMFQTAHFSVPSPLACRTVALGLVASAIFLHSWTPARDRVLHALPWLRKARFKAEQGLWLRALATQVAGGLPLVDSLERANSVLTSTAGKRLLRLTDLVVRGSSLEEAVRQVKGLDALAVAALRSQDQLADNLILAASLIELEIEDIAARTEKFTQPVALVLLGFPVALSVLAFWAPFYNVMNFLGEKT